MAAAFSDWTKNTGMGTASDSDVDRLDRGSDDQPAIRHTCAGESASLRRVTWWRGSSAILPVLVLMISACANPEIPVPAVPSETQAPMMYVPPVEQEYRFQVGDSLAVRSYFDPQFNQEVVVRPDGRITLLLIGDVKVVNVTPTELRRTILATYRKVSADPDIAVIVTKTVGMSVYLGGEVKSPSMQKLEGSVTVLQAVTAGGGLLPTANTNQVLLLRRKPEGGLLVYKIDLEKVLKNEAPDVFLQRQDVIFVPKTQIANIGMFVDQYINAIIPRSVIFSYGWTTFRNQSVQVVTP
jgi:polysaccharide export outer membrane protein